MPQQYIKNPPAVSVNMAGPCVTVCTIIWLPASMICQLPAVDDKQQKEKEDLSGESYRSQRVGQEKNII